MKKYVGLLLMGLMGASPAIADTVKVGYMTTLSGGAGIIGLIYATENQLFNMNKDSSPLVFLTEGKI